MFIGYSMTHKGYKCLSSTGRVYIVDTVSFNEKEFPYAEKFSKSADTSHTTVVSQVFTGPTFSTTSLHSPSDSISPSIASTQPSYISL